MSNRKGPRLAVVRWYRAANGLNRQELSCGHSLPCRSEDGVDHTQEKYRNCIHCYISRVRGRATLSVQHPSPEEKS